MRVIIKDDTYRRNKFTRVDKTNKETLEKMLDRPLLLGTLLPVVDEKGRKVQDIITMELLFENEHLDRAIKRAKRWIRNNSLSTIGPRHITEKLMAFKAANVEDFLEAVEGHGG